MKKIKMCKPFEEKEEIVEIYEVKKEQYIVRTKISGEDIKTVLLNSYTEALYLFYHNLCWIINAEVMAKTHTQRMQNNFKK